MFHCLLFHTFNDKRGLFMCPHFISYMKWRILILFPISCFNKGELVINGVKLWSKMLDWMISGCGFVSVFFLKAKEFIKKNQLYTRCDKLDERYKKLLVVLLVLLRLFFLILQVGFGKWKKYWSWTMPQIEAPKAMHKVSRTCMCTCWLDLLLFLLFNCSCSWLYWLFD